MAGPERRPVTERVADHRTRLRRQGLRPVQIWVPDTRSPGFAQEAHRQSMLAAAAPDEAEDQAFVDAISSINLDDDGRAVKRGELWTASAGQEYTGKPRPVVIVQDDRFDATASITICPLTSYAAGMPLLRIPMQPNATNGLAAPSSIMLDKITTVARAKLSQRIGRVSTTEMLQLERGILVFLGMTG